MGLGGGWRRGRLVAGGSCRDCLGILNHPLILGRGWCLGLLCAIYDRDLDIVYEEIEKKLGRKGERVVQVNRDLVRAGYDWATEYVPYRYEVPPGPVTEKMVVMNGNQAAAMGIMAAGIEVVAMYPITPATSVSHFLAASFHKVGGFLHQAEDEISAIGFALFSPAVSAVTIGCSALLIGISVD